MSVSFSEVRQGEAEKKTTGALISILERRQPARPFITTNHPAVMGKSFMEPANRASACANVLILMMHCPTSLRIHIKMLKKCCGGCFM